MQDKRTEMRPDNPDEHRLFRINSDMRPMGDQPAAIEKLVQGMSDGLAAQTLLGVTGSGKTFTMANIIEKLQRPALIFAHNKTLAAQLCAEFKAFFPDNAVEFFVSYYDYYQPEAYIAATDTYIEKDSAINDEIDRMRHSATSSLLERRDVIVVASVSCIYGLGDPADYRDLLGTQAAAPAGGALGRNLEHDERVLDGCRTARDVEELHFSPEGADLPFSQELQPTAQGNE